MSYRQEKLMVARPDQLVVRRIFWGAHRPKTHVIPRVGVAEADINYKNPKYIPV